MRAREVRGAIPPMYHVPVDSLAERVLGNIRRHELLRAGDRIGVAVSGGIDSVALLRLLLELRNELGVVVSVVHFNHGLRGVESDGDQEFVARLAQRLGLEFRCGSGDAAQLAAEEHSGLEAAARELRYAFFGELLGSEEESEDSSTSGAKAQNLESSDRSAESTAPPQGVPRGLKPSSLAEPNGTAEAVPLPRSIHPSLQTPQIILSKVATGHTLDDQAETVLMRLIRGTGMRGLGGIYPRILVEHGDDEGHGEIIRPLLGIRRHELQRYLTELKQTWREDSTNADSRFTRNRVRKLIMPLLERDFNPAVAENFSELAEIARDEEDYWENEIAGWLGTVVQWSEPEWARGLPGFGGSQSLVQIMPSQSVREPELLTRIEESDVLAMNASVSRPWLLTEPRAVQRRVIKAVGQQAGLAFEFKHIEEILRFAAQEAPTGKELSLPLGWRIVREKETILFLTPDLRREDAVADYEYFLAVPGRTAIPELRGVIEALRIAPEDRIAGYNSDQLLRADLLPKRLTVRNWRAGDRYWPAHTKAAKKVKTLLQERHLAQPERRLWPVILGGGNEVVWMRGFPVPARLRAKAEQEAVLIRDIPGENEEDTI